MRIVFLILSVFIVMTSTVVSPAHAREEGVALVVNEDAISFSDLNQRMAMIMISSGLQDVPEIREKLLPQVVGSLIDEQIKLQEARSLEISVSQEEIDQGFATIAQQNKFPPEKFQEIVKGSGINIATMYRQIEAQVAWNKVVQQRIRPQITVTESDIDSKLQLIESNKGANEYLLAEIFLPIESPDAETETRQLLQSLTNEMKKGARFSQIAQQFSKAPGAANGGDMGWVQDTQLAAELSEGLKKMETGSISPPIRTVSGYHILLLRDQRQISDETFPSREEIMGTIGLERIERKQRRYLLDLKSSAFIDNRIAS